jgi:hypothetical protein
MSFVSATWYLVLDSEDIVASVLSFVDFRTNAVASLVCKSWYAMMNENEYWKSLCVQQYGHLKVIKSLVPLKGPITKYNRKRSKKQNKDVDWRLEMYKVYAKQLEEKKPKYHVMGRNMLIECIAHHVHATATKVRSCMHQLERVQLVHHEKDPTTQLEKYIYKCSACNAAVLAENLSTAQAMTIDYSQSRGGPYRRIPCPEGNRSRNHFVFHGMNFSTKPLLE